jgi:hypothetical protein
MNFERARAIADAVLMEGYALYPYRASAPKNRYRWTFGVLAPQAWSVAGGGDAWWLQTQILVVGAPLRLTGRLRFFQVERRRTGDADAWDEGVLRTVDFEIPEGRATTVFGFDGCRDVSPSGVRERHPVVGTLVLEREPVLAERALTRVSIRVENHTAWADLQAPRERAMHGAFASVHVLIGAEEAAIMSAVDPPAWARAESARCSNIRVHPVLVGPPGSDDLVLAAPFIMQDHPQLAPESAGDLCDATEIDELLTLRTQLLTDDEKQQARATDARAAAIVDRAEALPSEWLARMHGAARDLVGGEMVPSLQPPQLGTKVRLLPPKVRTDAQDLLYAGHVATVVELREDVDGTLFLGVTVDDDPAAELHRWYGRCHYYRLEEVELL